jgi:hypothetical protein
MRLGFGCRFDKPKKSAGLREFAPEFEYFQQEPSMLCRADSSSPLGSSAVEGPSENGQSWCRLVSGGWEAAHRRLEKVNRDPGLVIRGKLNARPRLGQQRHRP